MDIRSAEPKINYKQIPKGVSIYPGNCLERFTDRPLFFQGVVMKKHLWIKALALTVSLAGVGMAVAQDQPRTQEQLKTQDQDQLRDQDRIYAHELMTDAERAAYRERIRLAKTMQERERTRSEHRIQMDARAKERGVVIMHGGPGAPGGTPGGSGSGSGGRN